MKHFLMFTIDGYDYYRVETWDGDVYFNACKSGQPPSIGGGYYNILALFKIRGVQYLIKSI
jgi:hypothetical protein